MLSSHRGETVKIERMGKTCVYHVKQPNFIGERLYPLNDLKAKLPAIYESAVKKYTGREWLLEARLPKLDCLWNDVLHFSLMHPSVIYKHLIDVGIDYSKWELFWFEVPLTHILAHPCALYRNSRKDRGSKEFPESEFEPVTEGRVSELSVMPERNLEYYRECVAQKTYPLLWGYAPHVLVKGEFDVSGYKVFDWRGIGQ